MHKNNMDDIFRDTQEQIDTFYRCALSLMLNDYKRNGITIGQAMELYNQWKVATIFKDGKIEFIVEE